MPAPTVSLTQDAEWCVVHLDGEWRQIRFHDYATLFSIPGLYEEVIYRALHCESPAVVVGLLADHLESVDEDIKDMRVLDLGAGNGIVGQRLRRFGAERIVGVDIIDEAREAAERDRPAAYDHYVVADLTDLTDAKRAELREQRLNCLVCVAALGFGDIPPEAFTGALDLIADDGWIAFNIKEDFLESDDDTGFAGLLRKMERDGELKIERRRRYRHRLGTDLQPLHYVAMIARKMG
ncbi:MAG: class I SAM-dependent methyltransferase [Phycisphaerales bacterium]|nr:class I SAM-dependent methyltransferase [Phycisphaerales bacterium]